MRQNPTKAIKYNITPKSHIQYFIYGAINKNNKRHYTTKTELICHYQRHLQISHEILVQ